MSGHTKEVWIARDDEVGYISKHDDQSYGMFCPIASVGKFDDARLIAAAPELLEVLKEVFVIGKTLVADVYGYEFVNAARAAIAKATGEQP